MWVTCWFKVTAASHSGRPVHSNVIEMGLSGSPLTTCDGFPATRSVKYVSAAIRDSSHGVQAAGISGVPHEIHRRRIRNGRLNRGTSRGRCQDAEHSELCHGHGRRLRESGRIVHHDKARDDGTQNPWALREFPHHRPEFCAPTGTPLPAFQ
jgi:hypothetical protein